MHLFSSLRWKHSKPYQHWLSDSFRLFTLSVNMSVRVSGICEGIVREVPIPLTDEMTIEDIKKLVGVVDSWISSYTRRRLESMRRLFKSSTDPSITATRIRSVTYTKWISLRFPLKSETVLSKWVSSMERSRSICWPISTVRWACWRPVLGR